MVIVWTTVAEWLLVTGVFNEEFLCSLPLVGDVDDEDAEETSLTSLDLSLGESVVCLLPVTDFATVLIDSERLPIEFSVSPVVDVCDVQSRMTGLAIDWDCC